MRPIPNAPRYEPKFRQISGISFSISAIDPRNFSVLPDVIVQASFLDCYVPDNGDVPDYLNVSSNVRFKADEFILQHPEYLGFMQDLKKFIENKAIEQGL